MLASAAIAIWPQDAIRNGGDIGSDEPRIAVSVAPKPLTVGDDLRITYTVTADSSGGTFDSVLVEIKSAAGTVIAKWTGQSGAAGVHQLTWTAGKWTEAPHTGAYANPKNGDYAVVVTTANPVKTASTTFQTRLVIQADLDDPRGAGLTSDLQSGLAVADLADTTNGMQVVLTCDDLAQTTITTTPATSDFHGTGRLHRTLSVAPSPLTLKDGTWTVELRGMRDAIGNFYDDDPNATGAQPRSWQIRLK